MKLEPDSPDSTDGRNPGLLILLMQAYRYVKFPGDLNAEGYCQLSGESLIAGLNSGRTNAMDKIAAVQSPADWQRVEFNDNDNDAWVEHLSDDEISELNLALQHAKGLGLSGTQVSRFVVLG